MSAWQVRYTDDGEIERRNSKCVVGGESDGKGGRGGKGGKGAERRPERKLWRVSTMDEACTDDDGACRMFVSHRHCQAAILLHSLSASNQPSILLRYPPFPILTYQMFTPQMFTPRLQDLLNEIFCGGYPGSRAHFDPKKASSLVTRSSSFIA